MIVNNVREEEEHKIIWSEKGEENELEWREQLASYVVDYIN